MRTADCVMLWAQIHYIRNACTCMFALCIMYWLCNLMGILSVFGLIGFVNAFYFVMQTFTQLCFDSESSSVNVVVYSTVHCTHIVHERQFIYYNIFGVKPLNIIVPIAT